MYPHISQSVAVGPLVRRCNFGRVVCCGLRQVLMRDELGAPRWLEDWCAGSEKGILAEHHGIHHNSGEVTIASLQITYTKPINLPKSSPTQ